MPSRGRTAQPRTPAAIGEDLKRARQIVGLARSDGTILKATVDMLSTADAPEVHDLVELARSILSAHAARVCRQALANSAGDPCGTAAANSLRLILLLPATDQTKAASLRRKALQDTQCSLKLDGLRKREDTLINAIARSAWADLAERRKTGPQTPEEIVAAMLPEVDELARRMHQTMRKLYPPERRTNTDLLAEMCSDVIYIAARLQWWAGGLLAILRRVVNSESDTVFAMLCRFMRDAAFASEDDRELIADLFRTTTWSRPEEFMTSLSSTPEGEQVRRRAIAEWLGACHSTCAYHRTYEWTDLCRAHLYLLLLEEFADWADDYLKGELDQSIVDISDPSQIMQMMRQ